VPSWTTCAPVLIERLDAMKCIVPTNFQVQIKTCRASRRLGFATALCRGVRKSKSARVPGTDIVEPRGLRLDRPPRSAQKKVFDVSCR
jgi:hypothetical protein